MSKRETPNIARPTPAAVKRYTDKWNKTEKLALQEECLHKLFHETCPINIDLSDILAKVCTLDATYSTNLYDHLAVARHIRDLKTVDQRLADGDLTLVNDIADVNIHRKVKSFYSFATKYCSHHKPDIYPIYDSYVERMLIHFKKEYKFYAFKQADLRQHPDYRKIMRAFMAFYGLEKFGFKAIDRYLWQVGREHFAPSPATKKKLGRSPTPK